jgi:hypothetical protein
MRYEYVRAGRCHLGSACRYQHTRIFPQPPLTKAPATQAAAVSASASASTTSPFTLQTTAPSLVTMPAPPIDAASAWARPLSSYVSPTAVQCAAWTCGVCTLQNTSAAQRCGACSSLPVSASTLATSSSLSAPTLSRSSLSPVAIGVSALVADPDTTPETGYLSLY